MKLLSLFFGLAVLAPTPAVLAHQPRDGDIHGGLGAFVYTTHELTHQFRDPILIGPAVWAEADLGKAGGIEISMYYLANRLSVRRDQKTVTEVVDRVHIATGYRYWIARSWSAALAFSSSYIMGDPRVIQSDFPPGGQPQTSARDIAEYGLDFSVQYEPWRSERTALVLDGRYGLLFTARKGEDANHYGVGLAVKFFLQSRQRMPADE